MRITESQLRRIIQEEKRRLSEITIEPVVDGMDPRVFYRQKSAGLNRALDHLQAAIDEMYKVSMMEVEMPEGEDADVQSATNDLQAAMDFITNIVVAVDELASQS
jgi:hypothetical protein